MEQLIDDALFSWTTKIEKKKILPLTGVLSASYEIDSIIISKKIVPNNPLCFSRFENK